MSNDLPLKKIKFDPPKIHKILGTEVRDAIYKDSLTKIGFEIKDNQIVIPSFRHDIAHQNDLAEEMARIIGYDNIKPVNFEIATGKSSKNHQGENLLRYYLASKGFNEVINMPFASCNTASLKIDNPLDSNRGFLRTSIENSLIENLLYNEKRQKESIKLFEISDIYSIKKDGEVQVNQYLGIIVSGRLGNNYNEFSKKLDSQYLIDLFKLNQKQVFEISRNELDTKIKNKIFMVLLKFEDLPESLTNLENQRMHKINFNTYEPISEFPSSARDLSFVLSNEKKIKKLEDIILNYKTDTLKSAFVFDFYNNNTGQIKIGFRLIFNSNNKTLTVDEVDNKIDDIVKSCMEIGGVEIPGYSK
jgi:phenylalanyl-tRNA synthetase beta chain